MPTTLLVFASLLLAPLPAASAADRDDGSSPPSHPAPADGFGAAVAFVDGVLYIGGPGGYPLFPMPASEQGAVHVFERGEDGAWTQTQLIRAERSVVGDAFGSSLAVSGDWMVVGAPDAGEGTGAAYVFQRLNGVWTEAGRLPIATVSGGHAGTSVALDGSVALVGAPDRADGMGGVDVFRRGASGEWELTAELLPSGVRAGDRFGHAVALTARRAVVGAPGAFPGLLPGVEPEFRAGSLHIFSPATVGWREEARIPGAPQSMLGWAVALREQDVYAAAPFAGQGLGGVARFARDGADGSWEMQEVVIPREPLGPAFGFSFAFAGEDLIVGAPLVGEEGNGAAYLYRPEEGGGWTETAVFEGRDATGFLGVAVGGMQGLAIAGAPGADVFAGLGQVVTRGDEGGWAEGPTLVDAGGGAESITGEVVECASGSAQGFACSEVDLMAFLPVSAIGGTRGTVVNDIWGWTDPETGREIAIVGRSDGTSFVDLSDPTGPRYLGELPPTAGSTVNLWRDIKVYRDHAYIVADGAGAHGVQIFDLTQLRGVEGEPRTFEETAHYDRIFSAHNIVINEETGFAYVVGAAGGGEICGGGLHMVDIREPTSPTFAGCFADETTGSVGTGYSHDAMCVVYRGPDQDHAGRELCFGANETALSIADVTDKAAPVAISSAAYPNVGYVHQGWITDDHRYFYLNDELDELSGVPATRTLVWDIQDLDDPILVKEHMGTTAASDHNLYVSGNFMYQSNYMSGLRILDISDPADPREVGFFDTVATGEDEPGFSGSWSNYPWFRSGLIAVTSMREGLFILKKRPRIS